MGHPRLCPYGKCNPAPVCPECGSSEPGHAGRSYAPPACPPGNRLAPPRQCGRIPRGARLNGLELKKTFLACILARPCHSSSNIRHQAPARPSRIVASQQIGPSPARHTASKESNNITRRCNACVVSTIYDLIQKGIVPVLSPSISRQVGGHERIPIWINSRPDPTLGTGSNDFPNNSSCSRAGQAKEVRRNLNPLPIAGPSDGIRP